MWSSPCSPPLPIGYTLSNGRYFSVQGTIPVLSPAKNYYDAVNVCAAQSGAQIATLQSAADYATAVASTRAFTIHLHQFHLIEIQKLKK